MFHATSKSSAASADIGTYATSGAAASTATRTVSECTTDANGDVAPARMLVAVRASAPVAAMPPKNGAAMLPRPSATSSAFGSCFLPVIASAMTAESSDSMAPSIAMASAGDMSSRTRARDMPPPAHGSMGSGGAGGMPAYSWPPMVEWNRDPIVATCSPGQARTSQVAPIETITMATSGAGTALVRRGHPSSSARVAAAIASSAHEASPRACQSAATFSK